MHLPRPFPITAEAAVRRVCAAEDAWNACTPEQISLGYSLDTAWRTRADFLRGRAAVARFLTRRRVRQQDCLTLAEPWAFDRDRIAVRFASEWRDDSGNWFRTFGNANWKLDAAGLIIQCHTSANDLPIAAANRRLRWARGSVRPADHPGLAGLGF